MAEMFRVPNYTDINLLDFTALTLDAAADQDKVTVLGLDGFQSTDYGLLGPIGSFIGEIHQIQSISGNEITFEEDLTNPHRKTEPFTKLFGTQIICYRAPNVNNYPPSNANYTIVSTSDIDADSPITLVKDDSGSSEFWYKFTYYNPFSDVETSLASSIPIRGGGEAFYCSIEDIRREAGLQTNNQIQDTQVSTRRDQAHSEVNGALMAAAYTLPLKDAVGNFYTPPLVENIERLLSAGYVLIQDYGTVSGGNTKDGKQKIDQAWDMIKKLQDHTLVLVDINGQPMSTNQRINGYPNEQTQFHGTTGYPEPRFFTISKKF